jgi:DNA-binding transcriptional LysR family regulator
MADKLPRTTVEQWAVLAAVVDEAGFSPAADRLGRSQSAVSYSIQQLEAQLPVALLDHRGRRAQLTDAGATLLRRARSVVEELRTLEALAASLAAGWETQIRIAVDIVFPPALLYEALARFSPLCRGTRLELVESVLSGTTEALIRRDVELAVVGPVPPGFLGTRLMPIEFIAVARPDHPLHALGRPIGPADLKVHRQVVVRDSGSKRRIDAGWLGADERWTVSHLKTSIEMLKNGLGFAWIPREHIWAELADGTLLPLPLTEGGTRSAELHLVYTDPDSAGPATKALALVLTETCASACARQRASTA